MLFSRHCVQCNFLNTVSHFDNLHVFPGMYTQHATINNRLNWIAASLSMLHYNMCSMETPSTKMLSNDSYFTWNYFTQDIIVKQFSKTDQIIMHAMPRFFHHEHRVNYNLRYVSIFLRNTASL